MSLLFLSSTYAQLLPRPRFFHGRCLGGLQSHHEEVDQQSLIFWLEGAAFQSQRVMLHMIVFHLQKIIQVSISASK